MAKPLHILSCNATSLPNDMAHPIQILETARALAKRSDVRLTLYFVSLGAPPDAIWRSYGMEPPAGVEMRAMLPRWYYNASGIGNYVSAEKHWAYRAVRWRMARALRDAAREATPVLHTRSENIVRLLAPVARAAEAPLFLEMHWLKYIDAGRKFMRRARRKAGAPPPLSACKQRLADERERECAALRQTDGLFCLTREIQRIVAGWGVDVPMAHLPSAVDLPEPMSISTHSTSDDRIDILYVGQLYAWKGVDGLIAALPYLPDRRLTIVGGNGEKDLARIAQTARDLGVADRVDLVGHVPHPDVADQIRRARVCVVPLPRQGHAEARFFTSPMKVFEFAAQSKAIVATDLPALRETLLHGENSWLVPPDDPQALAEGLRRVLEDDALRERLGAAARLMAGEHTFDRRAEQMLDFIGQRTGRVRGL